MGERAARSEVAKGGGARDPAADPPAFRFLNEIGIIDQLASRLFERVMPDDLTLPQFGVLNHFVRLGRPSTAKRLSAAFQVTKGAMAHTVALLEGKGFVTVSPHPDDGRAKLVDITPRGREARGRALAALGPSIERMGRAVPADEIARALPVLARVRAHLDAERDASGARPPEDGESGPSQP